MNSSNNVTDEELEQFDKWLVEQDDLAWENEQRQVKAAEQRTFLEWT